MEAWQVVKGLREVSWSEASRFAGLRENWGLSDFQAIEGPWSALCTAHRLDYLPAYLSPFHFPISGVWQ